MRERFKITGHIFGFRCPNHNTVILETVDLCNICTEKLKITAKEALVAFREMKIAEGDPTGGKMAERNERKKKRKEKETESLKRAGYLAIPAWDTKRSRSKNRQRSRSVGPDDKSSSPKSSRRKHRSKSLSALDLGSKVEELPADILAPTQGNSDWASSLVLPSHMLYGSDACATEDMPIGGYEEEMESLFADALRELGLDPF
ncbi:hypothetical protein V492_07569 [Pseudogymnoascus sp. VKM F-4246]|nr:hypothetical protein V492_07569 [Pseudogymnoascus sp. VKM F-4246]